ncbi:PepSY domain-containing protein [Eikenella sp. S3360]|uniref:PepSY domain-containing protein n=1 Tax=Eikenella glucosivorans TaxID=2766967 RepID=A0ABS0N874_9NEIS|nr:PepSY domain-containing protein [Eikenella glucosivorans]MBH5328504.1 PepSY domain-containing protein [Eikenella glucosivorans]
MSARQSALLLAAALMAVSLSANAKGDGGRHGDEEDHPHRSGYAQQHRPQRAQANRTRQGYISSSRAAGIAARHTRARVTDVDFTTWRGRRVYEVELDARRGDYEVIVDARSGRILSSKFDPDD